MRSGAHGAFKAAEMKPWRREVESQILILPYPVSVNAMFNDGDIGHGVRPITPEYKSWRYQAGLEIMRQRSGRVPGPVELHFTFEEKKGRHDIDNLLKGPIDLLSHKDFLIIDGDSSKTVRKIVAEWGAVAGCHVAIIKAAV